MSASEAREAAVKARFEEEVADHVMEIVRDDGLYRHIRFQKPGTTFYYFDLVTWPGYLAIVGDAGDYLLSRIRDMFDFFDSESGRINPHYWAQKLQGREAGRTGAQSYSHEVFAEQLYDWCYQEVEHYSDGLVYESLLRGAVDRELLYSYTLSEFEARERIEAVERGHSPSSLIDPHERGDRVAVFGETWEWDFRDYDQQFLWCCFAIVHGIKTYKAAKAAEPATPVATTKETAS